MIKLLARNYSHPIFGTDWVEGVSSNWDRLVIVRYKNRRAIAEVFANDEFAKASAHKWAAIKKNERILVQATHIPEIHIIAITILVLIGGLWLLRMLGWLLAQRNNN